MIHIPSLIAGLIEGLRRAVARAAPVVAAPARPTWAGPERRWIMPPHADLPLLPGPVWTLLWFRLQRLRTRLLRLHERWQAGTLPPPRPKPAARPDSPPQAPARLPEFPDAVARLVDAPARLPRGHGWVVRRIPEAGPSAGWLQELLQREDTRAFVRAAPQAARHLRPLCRMLAVDQPDWLKLPPRPRPPRTPRARAPRRLPLTHPDLKLRPYEIAAARYWIKKYGRDG